MKSRNAVNNLHIWHMNDGVCLSQYLPCEVLSQGKATKFVPAPPVVGDDSPSPSTVRG
eukprot:c32293_g1_i1 orf=58-231(+)